MPDKKNLELGRFEIWKILMSLLALSNPIDMPFRGTLSAFYPLSLHLHFCIWAIRTFGKSSFVLAVFNLFRKFHLFHFHSKMVIIEILRKLLWKDRFSFSLTRIALQFSGASEVNGLNLLPLKNSSGVL